MVSIRLAFAKGKGVNTRKVVETVGVKMATANPRTALKNLGISRYSECTQLATHVQRWAEQILEAAKTPRNNRA
jgi:hypothetical protein